MYQIESVFIGESQQGDASIKTEVQIETINNFKVGDVTRVAPNNFTLNCVRCLQTFRHFPEFTLHIEEHFEDVFKSHSINEKALKKVISETDGVLQEELVKDCGINEEYELEMLHDGNGCDSKNENIDQEMQLNECATNSESSDHNFEKEIDKESNEEPEPTRSILSRNNLKAHLAVHVKLKNIFCPICMKGFSNVHYAQKHIKSIHKQTISTTNIRKAQNTLKQIAKPKKSDQNGSQVCEVSKLKLNVLSSNYWRTEGKKYHCPLCIQWFAVPKYVQKHIRLVHGRLVQLEDILAAQIEPELMPEPTKSVEMVKQQQIQSIQREQASDTSKRVKSFECFACHTMFVSEKALRYHMPLHEGIQYACPLCEKYFSMHKYVRDHMIYKHGFDKKSKLPPLKMRKIENFEYHKPVVSRFECYLCRRTYPSRSKLSSHMKSHIDIMECSICTKVFKSNESRRRHMQLHSADPHLQHHCLICNKAFAVRRYMMSHMRTSHTNPRAKADKPPKVQKILTCEVCQKVFDKQGTFNKHIKSHNREPARYMCDYCGQEFEDRHILRRHLSSVHKISKKYFKCNVCQNIVPKKREEEHIKFHRGEKDHQCEICGSRYVTEGLLSTHKKRQHAGLKYECDICPERFDQPKKLLHHRRSHAEPMEIHCNVCNLGFFNTRSLNKHEMKKHIQNDINTFDDSVMNSIELYKKCNL